MVQATTRVDSLSIELCEDPWLSAIMGHGVFQVRSVEPQVAGSEKAASDILGQVQYHAAQQAAAMYYARVDTAQVNVVRSLCATGFYVVDVTITFCMEVPTQVRDPAPGKVSICPVGPEHHQGVLDIASSCFQYSRFHLDPLVPRSVANRIKHDWVLSYIRKQRGDELFTAVLDGRPVGFLAALSMESQGRRICVIDLIGVDTACQNQGVGRALTEFFIRRYHTQCDRLQVGTQATNIPSMRLYESLGFSVMKTQYVMHMHVGKTAASPEATCGSAT